jgi:hypothetical protein
MIRRLLFLLLLFAALPAASQIGAFTNWCQAGNTPANTSGVASANPLQGSFPKCQIAVFLTGTPTATTIYSTKTLTPLANPFCANADGSFLFFASSAVQYDVVMSNSNACNPAAGGFPQLPAPFTFTDISVSGIPGGGGGGGGTTTVAATAPILATPNPITTAGTISHATSGITAGAYTNPTVTFDVFGHATSASSGATGSVVSVNGVSIPAPNFNNTTPAAGTNGLNLSWQVSGPSVSGQLVGNGNVANCLSGTGTWVSCGGGTTGVTGNGNTNFIPAWTSNASPGNLTNSILQQNNSGGMLINSNTLFSGCGNSTTTSYFTYALAQTAPNCYSLRIDALNQGSATTYGGLTAGVYVQYAPYTALYTDCALHRHALDRRYLRID